jgi:hypothetical protein
MEHSTSDLTAAAGTIAAAGGPSPVGQEAQKSDSSNSSSRANIESSNDSKTSSREADRQAMAAAKAAYCSSRFTAPAEDGQSSDGDLLSEYGSDKVESVSEEGNKADSSPVKDTKDMTPDTEGNTRSSGMGNTGSQSPSPTTRQPNYYAWAESACSDLAGDAAVSAAPAAAGGEGDSNVDNAVGRAHVGDVRQVIDVSAKAEANKRATTTISSSSSSTSTTTTTTTSSSTSSSSSIESALQHKLQQLQSAEAAYYDAAQAQSKLLQQLLPALQGSLLTNLQQLLEAVPKTQQLFSAVEDSSLALQQDLAAAAAAVTGEARGAPFVLSSSATPAAAAAGGGGGSGIGAFMQPLMEQHAEIQAKQQQLESLQKLQQRARGEIGSAQPLKLQLKEAQVQLLKARYAVTEAEVFESVEELSKLQGRVVAAEGVVAGIKQQLLRVREQLEDERLREWFWELHGELEGLVTGNAGPVAAAVAVGGRKAGELLLLARGGKGMSKLRDFEKEQDISTMPDKAVSGNWWQLRL